MNEEKDKEEKFMDRITESKKTRERITKQEKPRVLLVKFGTECLTQYDKGLCYRHFAEIATQLDAVMKDNVRVIVVSSGAIAAGRELILRRGIPTAMLHKKELAGIGSIPLFNAWSEALRIRNRLASQVLVTHANLQHEAERKSIVSSLRSYTKRSIVPIINENDVVSSREIELMEQRISENDQLTRLICNLVNPDFIYSVTSVRGVFTDDPRVNKQAKMYRELNIMALPSAIVDASTKSRSGHGGMCSKITEMALCHRKGRSVAIGGLNNDSIVRFVRGERVGTLLGTKNRFYP